MPLRVYLQIIGHTTIIKGLEECLKKNLTIDQLPENIREEMFNRRIFSPKLNALATILKGLKLLEVTSISTLELLKETELLDDTVQPPEMKHYQFIGLSDVMRYWSELEFVSLHKVLEEQDIQSEEPSTDVVVPSKESSPDLRNPSNWHIKKPISRAQRIQLETYNFTDIPSKDETRIIAQAVQLTFGQVLFYFKHRIGKLKRQDDNVGAKTRKKRKSTEKDETHLFIKKSRKHKPSATQHADIDTNLEHSQAFKSKNKKRKEMEAENANLSEEEVEEEEEEEAVGKVVPERGFRATWTAEEDTSLLQAFVSFTPTNQTSNTIERWSSTSRKLDKSMAACERRFRSLQKDEKWKAAVKIAIAEKNVDSKTNTMLLPSSVKELLDTYVVKDLIETPYASTISNGVLAECTKILLLTPEQEINQDTVRQLFSNFPEHEIRQTFNELKLSGVIVKNKSSASMRSYQFSKRHNRFFTLSPFNSNLFKETTDFIEASSSILNDNASMEYQSFNTGGATASVLASVANNKVYLSSQYILIYYSLAILNTFNIKLS
jgi:hypothetical protein